MGDEFLPKIAVSDLLAIVRQSDKVQKEFTVGKTVVIILKGNKFIGKRTLSFRTDIEEVDYEYAIAISLRAGMMSICMDWFLENKNFKEGGYIVAENSEKNT